MPTLVEGMTSVPGIQDVHDLHVWSVSSGMYALSCHARFDDLPPSQSASILSELEARLWEKYQIGHATIQFECHPHLEQYCAVNGLYCQMEVRGNDTHGEHEHAHPEGTPIEQQKGARS